MLEQVVEQSQPAYGSVLGGAWNEPFESIKETQALLTMLF